MRWLVWFMFCGVLSACSTAPMQSTSLASASGGTGESTITRTSGFTFEVEDLKPAVHSVQAWVQQSGGQVESFNYQGKTTAYLRCRIPASKRGAFLHELDDLGELQDESQLAEDLSGEMINVGAELENLYQLRKRLKDLLAQALKVDDILSIERELNRVQTRIDTLEQMERHQQNSIQYSSFNLTLKEKSKRVLGPLGWLLYGAGWTLKKLFVLQ